MPNTGMDSTPPERAAFSELDSAVSRTVELLASERKRAVEAEAKSRELDEIVRRFTGDEAASGRLLSRLKHLEDENADLRRRLETGREGIDRLLARIRFLETQR